MVKAKSSEIAFWVKPKVERKNFLVQAKKGGAYFLVKQKRWKPTFGLSKKVEESPLVNYFRH